MVTKDLVNIGNARFTGKVMASQFIGSITGKADTADALTTDAGNETKPVYFSGGKPVEVTHSLVPMTGATSGLAGNAGFVPLPPVDSEHKFLRGDATWASVASSAYATCGTAAATAAKVATITGSPNWELIAGSLVTVYFSYTNTAANPTLNVNNTGAKTIVFGNTRITTDASMYQYAGYAARPITFIYDGAQYRFINWAADNDTIYSAATTSKDGLLSASDKAKLDTITESADAVTFARSLTDGTKVGTITINGTPTDLYAPTNTDTHYTTKLVVGSSASAGANAAASNGNVYLNIFDDTTVRNSHKIVGSGATTVSSDANGNITIDSTKYTLSSFGITSTAAELNILDGVTVNATKINYLTDVTSNIQTQLNGKAASSHGTHVTYATAVPLVAGTAAVGTAANVARGDHVHPAQTTITGNAGSATKLFTARTIDGVSFNGSAAITHFGTCSTAAATAAKTVALTGFSLVTGSMVFVKFTVTNTAANPTLNVNSTGAKYILYRGNYIHASALTANRVYSFVYDGNYWQYVGGFLDAEATTSAAGLMSANDKLKSDYTNIAYATCATAASTAAKVVALSGNTQWALNAGSMIAIRFTYTNTAANPTLNVNSTGAKSIRYNNALLSSANLDKAGVAARTCIYVYDGSQYVFVGWSYEADTNASLGSGYGTCATAAATVAKAVTMADYELVTNGIVAVKFTYAVPANATMNINGKGAKSIFYKGSAIIANIINAGDTASFIYDGTQYHLIAVDSGGGGYVPLTGGAVTGNIQQSGATTDYTTYKFRNIAIGTSTTPTSDSTYGGSGSIYIYCP